MIDESKITGRLVAWDKTTNTKTAASDPRSKDGLGKVQAAR